MTSSLFGNKPVSISPDCLNSLDPRRSRCYLKNGILNLVLLTRTYRSYDNALRWMPRDLTTDKSALVQVMAWCHQAASHYLGQCWSRSMLPYGITRPQWVNYCGLLMHMTSYNLVNIGSGTKPLPEPMLTNHMGGPVPFTGNAEGICFDMSLKINKLRLQLHLPGREGAMG